MIGFAAPVGNVDNMKRARAIPNLSPGCLRAEFAASRSKDWKIRFAFHISHGGAYMFARLLGEARQIGQARDEL